MIRRTIVHRHNRRRQQTSGPSALVNANLTASIVSTKGRFTSDIALAINGIPPITAIGVLPTAVTIISPVAFDLTYLANVTAGQAFVIPPMMLQARTSSGGYVNSKTGTF